MMSEEDKWKKFLQDRFSEHESTVPDSLWESITNSLPQKSTSPEVGRSVFKKPLFLTGVVGLAIGILIVWYRTSHEPTPGKTNQSTLNRPDGPPLAGSRTYSEPIRSFNTERSKADLFFEKKVSKPDNARAEAVKESAAGLPVTTNPLKVTERHRSSGPERITPTQAFQANTQAGRLPHPEKVALSFIRQKTDLSFRSSRSFPVSAVASPTESTPGNRSVASLMRGKIKADLLNNPAFSPYPVNFPERLVFLQSPSKLRSIGSPSGRPRLVELSVIPILTYYYYTIGAAGEAKVQSIRSLPVFDPDRAGISLRAGTEAAISKRLNLRFGLSYHLYTTNFDYKKHTGTYHIRPDSTGTSRFTITEIGEPQREGIRTQTLGVYVNVQRLIPSNLRKVQFFYSVGGEGSVALSNPKINFSTHASIGLEYALDSRTRLGIGPFFEFHFMKHTTIHRELIAQPYQYGLHFSLKRYFSK